MTGVQTCALPILPGNIYPAASLYEPGRRFHPVKFRIKLQIKKLIDDAYEQKNERLLRAFDKEMMAGINEYP